MSQDQDSLQCCDWLSWSSWLVPLHWHWPLASSNHSSIPQLKTCGLPLGIRVLWVWPEFVEKLKEPQVLPAKMKRWTFCLLMFQLEWWEWWKDQRKMFFPEKSSFFYTWSFFSPGHAEQLCLWKNQIGFFWSCGTIFCFLLEKSTRTQLQTRQRSRRGMMSLLCPNQ